jgi:alkylation response protein AidB-like acyl-CoA dehydrogenase
MDLEAFRKGLDDWLDQHEAELAPEHAGLGTLAQDLQQLTKVKRAGFEAGWMRWGWPERVGGLGGSPILRAYLGEALMARDLVAAGGYSMTEVLAPTMIDFAPPELAADMVPRLLRGDEMWCQGFSEPSTGSNLAALNCRAVPTAEGWRVTGQKVWTSYVR